MSVEEVLSEESIGEPTQHPQAQASYSPRQAQVVVSRRHQYNFYVGSLASELTMFDKSVEGQLDWNAGVKDHDLPTCPQNRETVVSIQEG